MSGEVERLPLNEEIGAYYLALGKFVTWFAEIEAQLRHKCSVIAKVPVDVSGVVFGNLTTSAGIDLLRKLRQALNLENDAELDRALEQFASIADARNAILHRGVDFDEDGFTTKRGLPNSRRREHPVSAGILEAMSADLNVISAALIVAFAGDEPSFPIWGEGFRAAARTPWQYTPAPSPAPRERRTGHAGPDTGRKSRPPS